MYATVEQFITRIGEKETIELTDRRMIGIVDEEILQVALADSSAQIDSYLARYKLPLAQVPQNLTRICCELARYHLAGMSDTTITDEITERYKLALGELKQIAKGEITLGVEFAPTESADGDGAVMFSNGNTRIFSRDHKN